MLWQVEILPKANDVEKQRVAHEFDLLTHSRRGQDLLASSSHGYLIEGDVATEQQQAVLANLLVDPVVELVSVGPLNANHTPYWLDRMVTVLLKPGVMDPAAQSVQETCRDLGLGVQSVRTYRRYFTVEPLDDEDRTPFRKVLANDAIEQVVEGPLTLDHLTIGQPYQFRRVVVPLLGLDGDGLVKLSREGQLALSLAEMNTIQAHFRTLGRDPTDVELETFAQTWSEHCSHKTLKGTIDFEGRHIENLLKQTIFGATQEIRRRLRADDWCVSVFDDNAGVVRFNDDYHVCFKVETHNHPSAIEPYGGASTGLGGVIRDVLGTALGAKPICNTDVFCFAPPDYPPEKLPPSVLHPRKVMQGVVAGVRDYGNRMGIPTVNGAVCFDERYLANPLVYCGTVGLLPVNRANKETQPGDLVVAVGGRTGRDGIHGATFSSLELSATSEQVSGGAVQIGNAITEKKMLDVLLQARDQNLYHAITDCGAGGFSSAVGEMGAGLGAEVHLERAPLKYEGLSYTEIWISESQERMVLAVPEANWSALEALCAREDVEAVALGRYVPTGRLKLFYQCNEVADLDMQFLHKGRPAVVRHAALPTIEARPRTPTPQGINYTDVLKDLLGSLNVCSKEWIVRQYDHEVQGGTVVKPLVGAAMDGPGDAAVITPVLGSTLGLAIGCGIQPRYGDLDPYAMAAAAIDEAVRNVVAVGADPARIALLDNFCWGNTDRPEVLGSLVRAAEACRDVALAYLMPFISGKDSLNNEYRSGNTRIAIPPTLLISALGRVPDVRRCVTMDLKQPGNALFLIGTTREELGGSHYHLVTGGSGGMVPRVDLDVAPRIFRQLHAAIQAGLVRACHDLSEGGLAVAVAEMAFAGGIGADVTGSDGLLDDVFLFSESATRFLVEVAPGDVREFQEAMSEVPCIRVGQTTREPRLRLAGAAGEWVVWSGLDELKEAWQKPLRW